MGHDCKSPVLVVGELNVDLIASGMTSPPIAGKEILASGFCVTLGSASAIFASGVAKLGHPVTFVSKVGKDDFGTYCLDVLKKNCIETTWVKKTEKSRTGVTISLSTPKDRALVTYLGAIAELRRSDVPQEAFAGQKHLHLTSYFLQHKLRPSFAGILRQAKRLGLTTSFDPNSDPEQSWRSDIWQVIESTDILFVNEMEALALTKKSDTKAALSRLADRVPCAVIKRGSKGSIATKNGEYADGRAFRIKAVDTTGAGDTFASGFVHGYLSGRSLQQCLEIGNACGAMCAMAAGGTTGQPTVTRLSRFLRQQR